MKTISALSNVLLKAFAAFGLVVAAAVVGVGIAAFFAIYEAGGRNPGFARSAQTAVQAEGETPLRLISLSRIERWQGRKIVMDVDASLAANRFVAADVSDRPQYAYADYQPEPASVSEAAVPSELASSPAAVGSVPPPLNPLADGPAPSPANAEPARLTDPGSHYIVDARTGKIVGIDGTLGALEEARQVQRQQAVEASHARREVRAALPVEAGEVSSDLPPPKPDLYPAVRRAMPVDVAPDDAAPAQQPFNAANELADDNRPVLRAQPVTLSQPAKVPRRLFSLP